MLVFILGLLVGFVMNIPVGPLNLLVVKYKIEKGLFPAFFLGLSASLMDGVYFFLIFSGLSLITFPTMLKELLQIAGPLFLLLLGVYELLKSPPPLNLDEKAENIPSPPSTPRGLLKNNHFLLGLLIYVSNPTLVATLSALATFIKSFALFPGTGLNHALFAIGATAGSLGWFSFVILLVKRFKNKFSPTLMQNLNRLCGLLLLLSALYMLLKDPLWATLER